MAHLWRAATREGELCVTAAVLACGSRCSSALRESVREEISARVAWVAWQHLAGDLVLPLGRCASWTGIVGT